MPLSFSFFSQHRAPNAPAVSQEVASPVGGGPPPNPFPVRRTEEATPAPAIAPAPNAKCQSEVETLLMRAGANPSPSSRPPTGGLAALAIQQGGGGLAPQPPAPRRIQPPQVAPAAEAVPAAPAPVPMMAPPAPFQQAAPQARPAAPSEIGVPNLQEAAILQRLSQLQEAIQAEIDLVKADVFGAAMGVSAMNDRIDDLEQRLGALPKILAAQTPAPAPAPAVSREEVLALIEEVLQAIFPELVEAVVQRVLQASQEQTGSLSSREYFRMPAWQPSASPTSLFAQPPLILSTSPS